MAYNINRPILYSYLLIFLSPLKKLPIIEYALLKTMLHTFSMDIPFRQFGDEHRQKSDGPPAILAILNRIGKSSQLCYTARKHGGVIGVVYGMYILAHLSYIRR